MHKRFFNIQHHRIEKQNTNRTERNVWLLLTAYAVWCSVFDVSILAAKFKSLYLYDERLLFVYLLLSLLDFYFIALHGI